MANPKQIQELLLTEHFTWTPIALIDDIINVINDLTYSATFSLETGLSQADPSELGFADRAAAENRIPETNDEGKPQFPEMSLEIEEGVHKLETLLENTIDKNFDILELWTLRNSLSVPPDVVEWVRLGHYKDLTIPSSPSTPQITPSTLQHLRRKLQETQKLHTALLIEKSRNEALLAKLHALVSPPPVKQEPRSSTSNETIPPPASGSGSSPFSFLTHTPAAQTLGIQPLPHHTNPTHTSESRTPLTTHTTFTTSQLPYLRSLLKALKPHLATAALPLATTTTPGETADVSRERKQYIESQTRRVLERRGVDTRDGVEGVVEGRMVGGEEVRGLESLVESMGKGKEMMGEEAMDTS